MSTSRRHATIICLMYISTWPPITHFLDHVYQCFTGCLNAVLAMKFKSDKNTIRWSPLTFLLTPKPYWKIYFHPPHSCPPWYWSIQLDKPMICSSAEWKCFVGQSRILQFQFSESFIVMPDCGDINIHNPAHFLSLRFICKMQILLFTCKNRLFVTSPNKSIIIWKNRFTKPAAVFLESTRMQCTIVEIRSLTFAEKTCHQQY